MDKKDILNLLEQERERSGKEKLDEYNVIIEYKKHNEEYAIVKGFIYRKGKEDWKLIFRGLMTFPYDPNSERWKSLKEQESKYYGIAFDTESKSIAELIKDFIIRGIKEGKPQDIIPKL